MLIRHDELFKKSSFLSVEKDSAIIMDKILSNNNLKKLLYYNSRDALHKKDLTEEESLSLINSHIKTVPKLYIDNDIRCYIIITFSNFTMDVTNPEFRDNTITFHIICHYDQWQLEDFMLRPFRVAAELDKMLDKARLTGIGTLQFVGMYQTVWNDEFGGVVLTYEATHGEEDKVTALNDNQKDILING